MRSRLARDLTHYQFDSLAEQAGVVHAVSGRAGGRSHGPFASLNLSFAVGDAPERVLANRGALCAALGISPADVVCPGQVHGDRVARVGPAQAGRGYADPAAAIPGCDALITASPGVFLWLTFADCVPVLLYDPARGGIGLVHAGWKGTTAHIVARAVEAMTREFGTRPADLLAGVAPAIGPCCYQVGPDVAEAVRRAFPGEPALLRPDSAGRHLLDLPGANALLLRRAGVPADRIEFSGYCTACRTDLFYSHRGSGRPTGRFAAVIGLAAGD